MNQSIVKMTKLLLLVVLAALSLELGTAAAEHYLTQSVSPKQYHGADLTSDEIEEAQKLTEQFSYINGELLERLPANSDPEANLKEAEQMVGNFNLFMMKRKKAVQLFVSLKEATKCDLDSYKILARNYESIRALADASRVASVLAHYQKKHAAECGPKYRGIYDELVKGVEQSKIDRVKRAFSTLRVEDFGRINDYQSQNLASFPLIPFTDARAIPALRKIARQVFEGAKESEYWQEDPTMKWRPVMVFDYLLFGPCKIYREQLGEVLTLARFDAIVDTGFLGKDAEFTDAIAYNRLCGSLRDGLKTQRRKLRNSLLKTWKELFHAEGLDYDESVEPEENGAEEESTQ